MCVICDLLLTKQVLKSVQFYQTPNDFKTALNKVATSVCLRETWIFFKLV